MDYGMDWGKVDENVYLSHSGRVTRTLRRHTEGVMDMVERLSRGRTFPDDVVSSAINAARLHDVGKLGKHFQAYVRGKARYRGTDEKLKRHSHVGMVLSGADVAAGIAIECHHTPIGSYVVSDHGGFDKDIVSSADYGQSYREMPWDDVSKVYGIEECPNKYVRKKKDSKDAVHVKMVWSLLCAADKGDLSLPSDGRDSVTDPPGRIPSGLTEAYKKANPHRFYPKDPSDMDRMRASGYDRVVRVADTLPPGHVYRLTMPTGMGKTLAVIEAAIRIGSGRRVVYCLPYTSIIDQTQAIMEDMLSVSGLDAGEWLITDHHLSETRWKGGGSGQESDSGRPVAEYSRRIWNAPMVLTTFVKMFDTLVSNGNGAGMRLQALADAVVVMDEIQSIPPKYFPIMSYVMDRLCKDYGTTFILATATQPELFPDSIDLSDPSLFKGLDRIVMDVGMLEKGPMDNDSLAERITREMRSGDSILVVLNKVEDARKLAMTLERAAVIHGYDTHFLSSHVTPLDRKKVIDSVKMGGGRQILVSTQVVEAGVDIDMDVVYRAYAPASSVIQAAGRCNRHMKGGKKGRVYVFEFEDSHMVVYRDVDKCMVDAKKFFLEKSVNGLVSESDINYISEKYSHIHNNYAQKSFETHGMLNITESQNWSWLHRKLIEDNEDDVSVLVRGPESDSLWERYSELMADENVMPWDYRLKDVLREMGAHMVTVRANISGHMPDQIFRLDRAYYDKYGVNVEVLKK